MAKQVDLVLTRQPDGTYRYNNNEYFPIDNQLFGNEGNPHNYHFTTEIHTTFTYRGGETFSFTGDDDLFVFINGKLAIDLGGVHGAQTGHVALSTLGLTVGQSYPLDIFQAERQCCGSNFSITTTLQLVSEPPAPVDNTPPTVTPTVTGTLGANDWYTSNINISWAVNDAETSITSSTGCTASTVSTDTNGMTFTCTATSDGGTASASVTVKRDASAPTVAGTVSGTQGSNSWYTSDVGVSWAVADATSGVASSTGCSATTTATDNAGTTYTCTATDAAGNSTTKSVSAKRDGTAPAVAGTLSGTVGNNGWYTSDVTASWATTDAMSGIATGCATTSTTTDNAGTTYSCTATDAAGNSTSKTMSAKRDATNPALGFSGNAGTYYVHQNVNITCATSDAMSGLASSSCPGASGAAYTFAVGSNTLNASATDNAGNVSLGSASFNVVVRSGDICTLVQQWVANKGVANSFCKQLEHQQYEAFRNHMSAQSGKHITAERAAILIALSRSL
jgi:fibro-slime domain-containing protein